MNIQMKCEKPEEINYTVTITMNVEQWKELRDQLMDVYPGSELRYQLSDILYQADRMYSPEKSYKDACVKEAEEE